MRASFFGSALPRDWLWASVTSIFKKTDKFGVANNRPVSFTICVKVIERLIVDYVLYLILSCGVIPNNQQGFVSRRSTVTNPFL